MNLSCFGPLTRWMCLKCAPVEENAMEYMDPISGGARMTLFGTKIVTVSGITSTCNVLSLSSIKLCPRIRATRECADMKILTIDLYDLHEITEVDFRKLLQQIEIMIANRIYIAYFDKIATQEGRIVFVPGRVTQVFDFNKYLRSHNLTECEAFNQFAFSVAEFLHSRNVEVESIDINSPDIFIKQIRKRLSFA